MIVGTGTFEITAPDLVAVSGDATWAPGGALPQNGPFTVGVAGNLKVGSFGLAWVAGHAFLTLTGSGVGPGLYFIENAPPGFTPTTNLRGACVEPLGFTNAADTVTQHVGGGSSSFTGISTSAMPPVVIPDDASYLGDLLSLITVDIDITGVPFTAGSSAGTQRGAVRITGNYDIVLYWWTIPDVSVCGVRAESHLQLAATDPGAPWIPLDPLDPDAAPDPTIDSIQPDHGVIAGGTAIEIHGSGFGDGCTVAIGGNPATSVVVVSQYLITCVTPAHSAGSATVVVTNEDGATS